MSHDFVRPTRQVVLRDTGTGDRYIPVAAMLKFARTEGFTGSEPELIRRMEAVGAHWTRETAVNPDDASESITIDMLRIPASLAAAWRGEDDVA